MRVILPLLKALASTETRTVTRAMLPFNAVWHAGTKRIHEVSATSGALHHTGADEQLFGLPLLTKDSVAARDRSLPPFCILDKSTQIRDVFCLRFDSPNLGEIFVASLLFFCVL
jgi:hypothetical protein